MNSKMLRRLLTIVSITLLYTVCKAVQMLPERPLAAVGLTVLLFAVMLSERFAFRASPEIYDRLWFKILSYVGSTALGLWATFIILSLPFDVLRLGVWLIELATGYRAVLPDTFATLYVWIAIVAITFVVLGFLQAQRGPKIRKVSVQIDGLPLGLEGFKIAQISDLHVGPTIRTAYVEDVVTQTNSTAPDIVILTGDIADGHAESIKPHLQPLKRLASKYGSYYVTGNHEYYWGVGAIVEALKSLGLKMLFNDSVRVSPAGGGKIQIAGVTDPTGNYVFEAHAPDLARAAQGNPGADVKILLAHQPGIADQAEKSGFDIQFSGHTHSGQFFPFSLFIGLAHAYSRGLYRHGKMWVYVNPGTGYWGPVNRLGVPSEISLITLSAHSKPES